MTSTMDESTDFPPPPGPPPVATPGPLPPELKPARLRRSRTDRVGVGLCGGLGRYFGLDPVIFRVLFAVLALFGGTGIALYLIGWIAVPDEGNDGAPLDRLIDELRRRHVPIGIAAGGGLFLLWLVAFSWWAPSDLIPAMIVAVVLLVLASRRTRNDNPTTEQAPAWTHIPPAEYAPPPSSAYPPPPLAHAIRSWADESRARARSRRRRSLPLQIATLVVLVVTVASLALADAVHGIPIFVYCWTVGGIVLAALLVGVVLRRTPWLLAPLLVPCLIGLIVFGGSPTSLHDGAGERAVHTTAASLEPRYRMAFGRQEIGLTENSTITASRTVQVRQGAGQVVLSIPRGLAVRVEATIRMGAVAMGPNDRDAQGGVGVKRSYSTPAADAAAPGTAVLTFDVDISAGELEIDYI